jgi:hypothetical protein
MKLCRQLNALAVLIGCLLLGAGSAALAVIDHAGHAELLARAMQD